jgi:phosphatidylinositol 3-kinase
VITYLLGVGDRHMENLMLTKDGHLFHIDFGWLFGRDPKPFPPPIKFCKEMVLAMGGAESTNYQYVYTTILILIHHVGVAKRCVGVMVGGC